MKPRSRLSPLLALLLVPVTAGALQLHVPGDYTTIASAVDAAVDGDSVIVAPGAYVEMVDFDGKEILVGSHYVLDGDSTHIGQTVLSQPDSAQVVRFASEEGAAAELRGFTLQLGRRGVHVLGPAAPTIRDNVIRQNGHFDYELGWVGAGVLLENSNAILLNNRIEENWCGSNMGRADGAGVAVLGGSPQIEGNLIRGNVIAHWMGRGGGLYVFGGSAVVRANRVVENGRRVLYTVPGVPRGLTGYGAGMYLESDTSLVEANLVRDNVALHGAGIYLENSLATLKSNCIAHNGTERLPGSMDTSITVSGLQVVGGGPVLGSPGGRNSVYANHGWIGGDIGVEGIASTTVWLDTFSFANAHQRSLHDPEGALTLDVVHPWFTPVTLPVIDVSPEGEDRAAGTSDDPLRTLQAALSRARPGEGDTLTLRLAPGDYLVPSPGYAAASWVDGPTRLLGFGHESSRVAGAGNVLLMAPQNEWVAMEELRVDGCAVGLWAIGGETVVTGVKAKNVDLFLHVDEPDSLTMTNSRLESCGLASSFGTVVVVGGGSVASIATFDRVLFSGGHGIQLGAVYYPGEVMVRRSIFRQNLSSQPGAGIWSTSAGLLHVEGTLFHGNQASRDAAISCRETSLRMENCTFVENQEGVNGAGAVVLRSGAHLVGKGLLFWGNRNAYGPVTLAMDDGSTAEVSYSLLEEGWAGEGNLDSDPQFLPGEAFLLAPASPAVDAGPPEEVWNDVEDPWHTGLALAPSLGTVRNDMGAYGGPHRLDWFGSPLSVEEDGGDRWTLPEGFRLGVAHPNPFNPATRLTLELDRPGWVEVAVFDLLGRRVARLHEGRLEAGEHALVFDGSHLASGTYFARARSGEGRAQTRRLVLLK